jgi:hypothetical protein
MNAAGFLMYGGFFMKEFFELWGLFALIFIALQIIGRWIGRKLWKSFN